MDLIKRYIFCWPTIYIYTFFIFVFSLTPLQITKESYLFNDRIYHSFTYALLSFIVFNTLSFKKEKYQRLFGFFYAFLLGLIIEVLQFFIPYRSFELKDILFNLLGSGIGVFLPLSK
jgi:VanZ family protein